MGETSRGSSMLAEGKTKIIWQIPGTIEVLVESKDDITAGDRERHDVMQDKALFSTQTTVNCFDLLTRADIPNHFVRRETDITFRAQRVDMIPIELVARSRAFGSYLKRNPEVPEKVEFDELVFELFSEVAHKYAWAAEATELFNLE